MKTWAWESENIAYNMLLTHALTSRKANPDTVTFGFLLWGHSDGMSQGSSAKPQSQSNPKIWISFLQKTSIDKEKAKWIDILSSCNWIKPHWFLRLNKKASLRLWDYLVENCHSFSFQNELWRRCWTLNWETACAFRVLHHQAQCSPSHWPSWVSSSSHDWNSNSPSLHSDKRNANKFI